MRSGFVTMLQNGISQNTTRCEQGWFSLGGSHMHSNTCVHTHKHTNTCIYTQLCTHAQTHKHVTCVENVHIYSEFVKFLTAIAGTQL